MLGGVRGALSIALAATITTSAVVTQNDLRTINTMVFGVAFISIVVQVPLLFRYVKRQMPETYAFKETELDKQFIELSEAIEQAHKLKSEGKISNSEFTERLEEGKMALESLMATSRVSLETKQILRARASSLFPALPTRTKQKQNDDQEEEKTEQ